MCHPSMLKFQMSELSQFNDDGNVLTHGGLANRKARGRKPLDYQDNKSKVKSEIDDFYNERHFLMFSLLSSGPVHL